MEQKDIENPIAEEDFRHQLRAEKEVNKISSNLPVICSVCKAELDEKGECYYCLRQWAMLWSG